MTTESTAPAPQRRHESPELGAAAARMMRALVVRAVEGDTEALEQLAALERLVPQATQLAGAGLHSWGYSHSELANVVGISRQASVKRFNAHHVTATALAWYGRKVSSGQLLTELVGSLAARRAS